MKILKRLASIRFTLYIFFIITLLSIAGIIIPQNFELKIYVTKYGQFWAKIIQSIQFNDIYNSLIFNFILYLFFLNLFLCLIFKIIRNIKSISRPTIISNAELLLSKPIKDEFKFDSEIEFLNNKIQNTFKDKKCYVNFKKSNNTFFYGAKKGRLNKIGSSLLHGGILLFFVAAFLIKENGFSYYQKIYIQDTIQINDTEHELVLNDFSIPKDNNKNIKNFVSNISLLKNNTSILTQDISVNKPLVFENIHVYQSSYGKSERNIRGAFFNILFESPPKDTIVFIEYDSFVVINNLIITATNFYSDFDIDFKTKEVINTGIDHNNPAIKINVMSETNKTILDKWLFFFYPQMHNTDFKNNIKVYPLKYIPIKYSVFHIRNYPGLVFIWAGLVLCTVGIILLIYLPIKCYWVIADAIQKKIYIAAECSRPFYDIKNEFDEIKNKIIKEY